MSDLTTQLLTQFEVLIDDQRFSGWKTLRVSRKLEHASSDFDVSVPERWPIYGNASQIFPGAKCEIYFQSELVLTGYVDKYAPSYSATDHEIGCTGRSKTMDFVDCSVTQTNGQFKNMTP